MPLSASRQVSSSAAGFASVTLIALAFAIAPGALAQSTASIASTGGIEPAYSLNGPGLSGTNSDQAPSEAPKNVKSFDLSAIDTTADPCADFYRYACGNWIKQNPIPSDQTRWIRSFSVVMQRNSYLLWQLLDAASKSPQSPLEKKYGDFYGSCMDAAVIERRGLMPLEPALTRIDRLADSKKLASLMGEMQGRGDPMPLFTIDVEQDFKDSSKEIVKLSTDGLSLPDREYYLSDDQRFKVIRAQYLAHLAKIFLLAGDTAEKAPREAADVLRIETELARASMSRTEMRDPEKVYHILTVGELKKLSPSFNWAVYFQAIGIGHFETLDVEVPSYFTTLNQLITTEPAEAWRSYLRWHVLNAQADDLPKAFADEHFAFFGKTLDGQEEPTPRWKRCTYSTDDALGEAVGQDWVKRNFPPQAKDSMDKLVAALDKAFGEDIQTLPWMSDATKKAAEEKLALIRNKIGYPEKWRDYSKLDVKRDDRMGNLERAAVFNLNRSFAKLGKPVDEKEWGMTPPTVDAYYDGSMNDINFPAGILQPPFFDASIDPAVNFGGIGAVIGHEMTHGFDDEGSKFDGRGNMREWQSAEDRKAFTERTDCEANEYSGFVSSPAHDGLSEQKLNGKLTLGENTADNGGLRIAYLALLNTLASEGKSQQDKIDGYTEAQRFFLGFGQVWCGNETDQSLREAALTDEHSPGKWRVNGAVQNLEDFGKAFGCKKGQPMYPVKSCRVW